MPPEPDPRLPEAARADQRLLWALCYRMTGVAADADELVQDTFLRCLERPPPDADRPLRPWLVKVALNLSRDRLRHRRSQAYIGPWLPSPVPLEQTLPDGALGADERLALARSASMATLLALEALTPEQRAIWLLREVFDWSGAETAAALDSTEGAVKMGLSRARKALARARSEAQPWNEVSASTATLALAQFLGALRDGDAPAALAALDEAAVLRSDGAGLVLAARMPVAGAEKIVRFYLKLLATQGPPLHFEMIELNGGPAFLTRFEHRPGRAEVSVLLPELGPDGRILALHSVLAPAKLTALPPG